MGWEPAPPRRRSHVGHAPAAGDPPPNIALGVELGRRGRDVTLVAFPRTAPSLNNARAVRPLHCIEWHDPHLPNLIHQVAQSSGPQILGVFKAYAINSSRPRLSLYIQHAANADTTC